MKNLILPLAFAAILVSLSCMQQPENNNSTDVLFNGFVNPPAEVRPFVRWWWNGNRIQEKELIRELDVM